MIVTADNIYGTIGGGNLEYQACRIARDQLESGRSRELLRFPLGAGLGQCCGGLVNLQFEKLVNQQSWDRARDETWVLDLTLFGAGHVGLAVVRAMQALPVAIRWVDSRDDVFPETLPNNVACICTDSPEAEVAQAPGKGGFLVMTHDHSLDQLLCEEILQYGDFIYFGLIGSRSKRRMFETRLQRRGIAQDQFERLTCPIGIDGIYSKQPAAIAISVAAQIMQVYDRAQNNKLATTEVLGELGGRG